MPECFLAPLPEGLKVEEAAGLPVAFLTAYYGLYNLAQLRAGERVLIHAAAGGVGLAAVQLAQRQGAEIFATAGVACKAPVPARYRRAARDGFALPQLCRSDTRIIRREGR